VSPATVKNDWTFARAWLKRAVVEGDFKTPAPDGGSASSRRSESST
jgi:hypothetical protein